MNAQELNPEEILDEVDEPRDAPPSAVVIRFKWLRWLLEKTPGLQEKQGTARKRLADIQYQLEQARPAGNEVQDG